MANRKSGAGSLSKFVGTWKLVSYEVRDHRGKIRYPLGREARGILCYDAIGNMSGQMMKARRRRYATDDLKEGSIEEMALAIKGYLAYFGTYRIDENERTVIHRVKGSLFPNWVGTSQKRAFRFQQERLILSADFKSGRNVNTAILTWKRFE